MEKEYSLILEKVKEKKGETIEFLQKLVQTPSLSGEEEGVANIIFQKMKELGYDEVKIDKVGNVIGIIKGERKGKELMYNSHMDHVPPSDMEDPYSGKLMDGKKFGVRGKVVYGRSACDMSGQIASTLMAGCILKELDMKPLGNLIVTFSVTEEKGTSFGSRALIEVDNLNPDLIIVTEATEMELSIGHRGAVHPHVEVWGKSAHSSAPERGINALYKAVELINEIRNMIPNLPSHPRLGKTTLSINTINVEPSVINVIPSKCSFDVDVRNIPNYSPDEIVLDIERLINKLKKKDPQLKANILIPEIEEISYTGYKKKIKKGLLPFYTDPNLDIVVKVKKAIEKILIRPVKFKTWKFATDASYFSEVANIPTIGFGPGNEKFAHSKDEHMPIKDLIEAVRTYSILPLLI